MGLKNNSSKNIDLPMSFLLFETCRMFLESNIYGFTQKIEDWQANSLFVVYLTSFEYKLEILGEDYFAQYWVLEDI